MKKNQLRSGYSTGTCVMLSVRACVAMLFENIRPATVSVQIPIGETVEKDVYNLSCSESFASASVTKDGGDDPDDTHGLEIGCRVRLTSNEGVSFIKGEGVGVVTLPGLALPQGEPAINPAPREMITKMLYKIAYKYNYSGGFEIQPFVPEGEQVAKKTFNPRVGIIGGISILGTTGVVKPYSSDAFVASIRQGVEVLLHNGGHHVVLNSGGRSEKYVKGRFSDLSHLSFIQYGNFIGETLKIIDKKKIEKVTICIMLGKAVKLAQGHLDTHSHKVQFSSEWLSNLAKELGYPSNVCDKIVAFKLAGQLPLLVPMKRDEPIYQAILQECKSVCETLLNEIPLEVILVSKEGVLIDLLK
ncbi:cobalt-precorrin-5B (C(1))-methyltransferase CbiD [Halosquirtibacter laminarini]|uniref:Cobalt-precorrin-5B (C(1))-methyltransferase CbiD n=1 Tax=Halosquirtibacter laminarini TaxID=3374600 RepID=A0AC61NPB1_9BACT|nr:cobalt-precorrin-5B (C(1))-methyltransferase CbiD [Prolixibacteraceae bacterium]